MLSEDPRRGATLRWETMTSEEKRVALSDMAADLGIHAERFGDNIISTFGLPVSLHLDDHREALLWEYDRVLADVRGELLEDLRRARPADHAENHSVATIRKLLSVNPNFPAVTCEAGHVTGSALIVGELKADVLLHRHRKLYSWGPLSGHPDYEVIMMYAAFRQAFKVSGTAKLTLLTDFDRQRTPIDIDLQYIPETSSRAAHLHADFRYVFATPSLERLVPEAESENFRILSVSRALAEDDVTITPPVKRLIQKAQALLERKAGALSVTPRPHS